MIIKMNQNATESYLISGIGNYLPPPAKLKAADIGMEERILDGIQRNGELTVNVSDTVGSSA